MADTHNSVMLLNADGTGTEYGATGGSGGTKVKATYDQTPALYSHNVGDIIYFNNYFYKATQAIAVGNTIAVGTNIQIAGLAKDTAVYIENLPGDDDPIQAQIDAIVNVYGSKNLLPYPYEDTTKVENGITYTDIGNGIVNVNGTASGESIFVFNSTLKLAKGTYIVSTEDAIPSNVDAVIQIYNTSYSVFVSFGTDAKEATFTLSQNETLVVRFKVNSGYTLSNFVLKPMIRDARITDPTWVPFAMTNRQLTESVEELRENTLDADSAVDITPYTTFANAYINDRDGIVIARIGQGASNRVAVGFKEGLTFLDAFGNASGDVNYSFPVRKGQGLAVAYNIGSNNTVHFYPFAD